jgi:hypothetical protein
MCGERVEWIVRPLGFHLLAAVVLVPQGIAAAIGLFIGAAMFDPRPFFASDNEQFDPTRHPTFAGYSAEVAVAAIAVIAVGLLLIPVLRRAGSIAPVVSTLVLDSVVIGATALLVIDEAIKDGQPGGCCAGPGLDGVWWHVWIATAILVMATSLISSAWAVREGRQSRVPGSA